MILLFLSGFFGCSSEGLGSVTSEDDAPWSMNDAVTFLFTPGHDNNGRRGSAVLAISTDAGHDCTDVETGPPAGGSGLWFVVGYDTGRSEGAASPARDGLYASDDVKAEASDAIGRLPSMGGTKDSCTASRTRTHGLTSAMAHRTSSKDASPRIGGPASLMLRVCPKAPDPSDEGSSDEPSDGVDTGSSD